MPRQCLQDFGGLADHQGFRGQAEANAPRRLAASRQLIFARVQAVERTPRNWGVKLTTPSARQSARFHLRPG